MNYKHNIKVSVGNGYTTKLSEERGSGDISIYSIVCARKNADAANHTVLHVSWSLPAHDISGLWHSDCGMDRSLKPVGMKNLETMTALSAPVMVFYDSAGRNKHSFALSEVKRKVCINAGIREEDGTLHIQFQTEVGMLGDGDKYILHLRVDRDEKPYYQTLKEVSEWWEKDDSNKTLPPTESAWKPMYSTWYSWHQDLNSEMLEKECRHAVSIGMKTIIVDDGWQTSDNNRGYAYCGDWQVEKSKFPDMKAHVQRVHDLDMKYMVWFSVPYVGRKSSAWNCFKNKLLIFDDSQQSGVLDPRYPEVREYLVSIYEKFVKEYDIDGLKLDFIDQFYLREYSNGYSDDMDFDCVQNALDCLMTEIKEKVTSVKKEFMIEFRQKYIGPNMRKYGNIFRVGDCPYSAITNRVGTLDLRLLSGKTAVHSDMLMWHPDDSLQSISQQIINCIFSVIQFSVKLQDIDESKKRMLSWWITFMEKNSDLLYHSRLLPLEPENLYPEVRVQDEVKQIIALYSADRGVIVKEEWESITILNASAADQIIIDNQGDCTYKIIVKDYFGEDINNKELICFEKQIMKVIVHTGYVVELTEEK